MLKTIAKIILGTYLTITISPILTTNAYTLTTGSVKLTDQNEIIEKRTENSQTFDNKNGTYSTRIYAGQTFIKSNNTWVDTVIDKAQIKEFIPVAKASTTTTWSYTTGDTMVHSGNSTTNYNNNTYNYVGKDNSNNTYRSFYSLNAIPELNNIATGTVKLYIWVGTNWIGTNNAGNLIQFATTTAFDPTTITWNTMPTSFGPTLTTMPLNNSIAHWDSVNFTNKLDFHNNIYLRLKSDNETAGNLMGYSAYEHASDPKPYFEITYDPNNLITQPSTTATSTGLTEKQGNSLVVLFTGLFILGIADLVRRMFILK